jgi:cyclic beta-1,2-glucan synthetase
MEITLGRWLDPGRKSAGSAAGPLRGELLSVEHLEERARVLAATYTLARSPRRRPHRFLPRLHDNARVLRRAYQALAQDVRRGEAVAPAAEWLLDNFHLVEAEIREVRRNLPHRYYLELPKLASRERAGMARIHAMALEFLSHSDARFDLHRLTHFISAYQTVAPLTLGELWAWPSMLRLGLIENLRRLAEEIMESRSGATEADEYFTRFESIRPEQGLPALPETPSHSFVVQLLQHMRALGPRVAELRIALERRLAAQGLDVDEAVRAEHQRQTMGHASTGNSITSLRLVSTIDWNRTVERVSLMEQVLQRDPAGVYGQMDFISRDRYRQAVEELAEPTGEAQMRVALRVIESARQSALKHPGETGAHIGEHLIGPGRREFEVDVAYVPRFRQRVRRFLFAHPVSFFLGSIAFFTALGVVGAMAYARDRGAPISLLPWIGGLALLPASQFAVLLVQKLVHRVARPRRLPRIDLRGGVPEDARTMVVIPTLLGSIRGARALVEHLEVQALGTWIPTFISRCSPTSRMRPRRSSHRTTTSWPPRWPGSRGSTRVTGTGAAIGSFSATARDSGTPARACGWAGSGSAASSRSSTPSCAARPTRRSASWPATRRSSRRCASASPWTPTRACRATPPAS